jgi:hypothetical protein
LAWLRKLKANHSKDDFIERKSQEISFCFLKKETNDEKEKSTLELYWESVTI